MFVFAVATAVAMCACGKDATNATPAATQPTATQPAQPHAKTFECEKNLHACYVPGDHEKDFLHYSDCTLTATGEQPYGCSPQDNAFCYKTAASLVCISTQGECDAVVTAQRNGTAKKVEKLAPLSDCTERKASEF